MTPGFRKSSKSGKTSLYGDQWRIRRVALQRHDLLNALKKLPDMNTIDQRMMRLQ